MGIPKVIQPIAGFLAIEGLVCFCFICEYYPLSNFLFINDTEIKMLDWDASVKLNITPWLSTQLTFADQQIGEKPAAGGVAQ